MKLLTTIAKRVFTRPVRIALYTAGLAADASLIASGDLPAWTAAIAAPSLLALFNLSPRDVEQDPAPDRD